MQSSPGRLAFFHRGLFWFLLAAAALPSQAAGPIEAFQARYSIHYGKLPIGESERSLARAANGDYLYTTRTRSTGLAEALIRDRISEQSRFRYVRGRPQALEYRYERVGGKRDRAIHVQFDWRRKLARGVQDGRPWQVALQPGVHDALLYQLAASLDLQRGQRTLSYRVADEGELKPYELAIEGEEVLDTPLGRLATVKLRRLDDERDTTLWMARDLAYLPVRIEHVETDGKRFSARIQSLSGLSPAR